MKKPPVNWKDVRLSAEDRTLEMFPELPETETRAVKVSVRLTKKEADFLLEKSARTNRSQSAILRGVVRYLMQLEGKL